jgi:hypothetical protein
MASTSASGQKQDNRIAQVILTYKRDKLGVAGFLMSRKETCTCRVVYVNVVIVHYYYYWLSSALK